jgi:hypothetical protein
MGRATIKDIPTERFKSLIGELVTDGWRRSSEYAGFDAWIDYGRITLRKRLNKLTCEWDNWTEGSIEGRRHIIEDIAARKGLTVTYEWRWSEYDEKRDGTA